jgi:phosphohistidine swiveling domain-containing protein
VSDSFPIAWENPRDAELAWEWEEMHCPRVFTPLAGDYMASHIEDGLNYRYEKFGMPIRYRCRLINNYVYIGEELDPTADREALREKGLEGRLALTKDVRQYWEQRVFPTMMDSYKWMERVPLETAPLAEVAGAWDEFWQKVRLLYRLHFMTNAGSYQSLDSLIDLCTSLLDGISEADALRLVQGLPNDLQRVQRDLFELARQAGDDAKVAEIITGRAHSALTELKSFERGREFLHALDEFLSRHGHLGQSYDDLALPSWKDEPVLVILEIQKRLWESGHDPESARQRLAEDAEQLAEDIRAQLRGRPDDLARFEEALAHARAVGPLTESHNYWLDRMAHAHSHRFAVRVGQRLVEAGGIEAPADIFYLYAREVGALLRKPKSMRPLVAARKSDLKHWSTIRPPKYVGKPSDLGTPSGRFGSPPPEQTDAALLKGIGACPGKVAGPARVVVTPEQFEGVKLGDILVCPSSNPSWVPLFGIIRGLVTNTGGVLSHAAVVAREFGVPAVVGTGEATRRIRDGQWIEVDGTAGEVRIL